MLLTNGRRRILADVWVVPVVLVVGMVVFGFVTDAVDRRRGAHPRSAKAMAEQTRLRRSELRRQVKDVMGDLAPRLPFRRRI